MHTIFLMNKSKNTGLFPLVMQAFRTGTNVSGVVKYRNLHWRLMSDEELAVEIYGEPVTKLPEALKYASFELYMYDFLDDGPIQLGEYKHRSAKAYAWVHTAGKRSVYEVVLIADNLRDLNEMYRLIIDGKVQPFDH